MTGKIKQSKSPIHNNHKCPAKIWRQMGGLEKTSYNSYMQHTEDAVLYLPTDWKHSLLARHWNIIRHNLFVGGMAGMEILK